MKFDGYKHADMPPDWEEERRGLPKAMDDAAKPVPACPPSSGVSEAPTEQELTTLRRVLKDEAPSYRDTRCGHNYDLRHCPYPHCAARKLYDLAHAYADTAKARGEKP